MENIYKHEIPHECTKPILFVMPLFCKQLMPKRMPKGITFDQFFTNESQKMQLLPPEQIGQICIRKFCDRGRIVE